MEMVDSVRDYTLDMKKYTLRIALIMLRQLYAVLFPEKSDRAVFPRQSPFVFHNSDMQHLYYDIHEWGSMIESHIDREGLDLDNSSDNRQLRLAEIVYSFAGNNSINVPEDPRLIWELLPPYFKTIKEYLGHK